VSSIHTPDSRIETAGSRSVATRGGGPAPAPPVAAGGAGSVPSSSGVRPPQGAGQASQPRMSPGPVVGAGRTAEWRSGQQTGSGPGQPARSARMEIRGRVTRGRRSTRRPVGARCRTCGPALAPPSAERAKACRGAHRADRGVARPVLLTARPAAGCPGAFAHPHSSGGFAVLVVTDLRDGGPVLLSTVSPRRRGSRLAARDAREHGRADIGVLPARGPGARPIRN
jgi:hypothetical protein